MNAVVSSPETWKKVIEVEIPVEDIIAKAETKLQKHKKEIKLPGFRAGKVPEKMIRAKFFDAFKNEATEELINECYGKACAENNINPVSQPIIEDVKADDMNAPVVFKAVVEVDPEITISNYENLGITVQYNDVTEEDITEATDNIRMRFADFNDLDRAVESGDFVTLEYTEVKVDGEDKADFTPAPKLLEVGKSPLADLDSALVGMKQDEEKQLTLSLPADFSIEEFAGKELSFVVTVMKVQEKKLPELSDSRILEGAKMESEEELLNKLRTDIKKYKDEEAENRAYDAIIDKILESNDFQVPPTRIQRYVEHIMQQESHYFPPNGQPPLDMYMERYAETAEKALKRYRILDFIASERKVKATAEEVDAKIAEIAEQYHQDFDTMKDTLRKNGATIQLREDIRQEKTLKILAGLAQWPEND